MARPTMDEQERAAAEARRRSAVLVGLATSIIDKGYAATTVADIAAAGSVSKSAVYELVGNKETAFLQLYVAANAHVIDVIRTADETALAAELPWLEHLELMLANYLRTMLDGGALTRCLLSETAAIGPSGLEHRTQAINGYVDLFADIGERIAAADSQLRVSSRPTLMILVGGLHELMLQALCAGTWDVDELVEAGVGMLASALSPGPVSVSGPPSGRHPA